SLPLSMTYPPPAPTLTAHLFPSPFHVSSPPPLPSPILFFFFNDPPPPEISTLSLHDAMPIRLDRSAPDFSERFRAFLATKREASADADAVVRTIVEDVAPRGDRALSELSRKLDRVDLDQAGLRVGADEIDAAYAACDRRALDALALARDRIEAYHRRQLPADER